MATTPTSELTNQATVRWSGDRSWFSATLPYDHTINIDEPEPVGGNHGPRPTDVLLAAAASCSGISASGILKKMRQPVTGLIVTATGDRQPEWPKAYTRIRLAFEVTVSGAHDKDLIEKAVNLAVRKYCPVSATIESGEGSTTIEYSIEIVGPET